MKVIIDTNILAADPHFKSIEMTQFRKLCQKGKISCVLPDIVLNEFKTQQEDEVAKVSKPFLDKLLARKTKSVYKEEVEALEKSILACETASNLSLVSISSMIEAFKIETKAKIIINRSGDLKAMLRMYFSGEKPFSAIKQRTDIPDCLIFLQIKREIKPDTAFISSDNNLRSALSQDCKVYKSLKEFIESEDVKEITETMMAEESLQKRLFSQISNSNSSLNLLLCSALEKELGWKEFTDEDVLDDNHEAKISGNPSIDKVVIDESSIVENGVGLYTFSFSCVFETLIEYFISISDYYCVDPERSKHISVSEWNDHYYDAEEYVNIMCIGYAGIQVDLDGLEYVEDDIDLLDDANISFSDIEISIDK